MFALLTAALTFVIVFWTVWELGQPWIHFGLPVEPKKVRLAVRL